MTVPPFDYPALALLAGVAHDLENAVGWPPALAGELTAWSDPGDPAPLRLCAHLAGGPTTALYGMAHEPRVIVCPGCFVAWDREVAGTLAGGCGACGGPDGRPVSIDAGYVTLRAYLCPGCVRGRAGGQRAAQN